MPTPTGQIGFSDLNVEMLQAASTTQIGLNSAAQRLGYGSTATVSISQLRKAYGATVTCGPQTTISKGVTASGYYSLTPTVGSVDDSVIDGTAPSQATFAAAYTSYVSGTASQTIMLWRTANTVTTYSSGSWQRGGIAGTGYEAAATQAGGAQTTNVFGQNRTSFGLQPAQYTFPTSGTVTVGLKWS